MQANWQDILDKAVTEPGSLHKAYRAFHGYSVGNQMLLYMQAAARGMQVGPAASFKQWKDMGRSVRKGQKALFIWIPITRKSKRTTVNPDTGESTETEQTYVSFTMKPRVFLHCQTDGRDVEANVAAGWDRDKALAELGIEQVSYDDLNGNAQGYALENKVAINPMCELPQKTMFHEVAHVLLGHTKDGELSDAESTPPSLREVEAEGVALICCESLGLQGSEYSRGYIQHWLRGQEIPEQSARRIFATANKILKAGQEEG